MWPRLGSTAVGIWLMAAPAVLQYDGTARTIDHTLGPVAASAAIVAMWEVVRGLLAILGVVRGRVASRFGGGWRAVVRRSDSRPGGRA